MLNKEMETLRLIASDTIFTVNDLKEAVIDESKEIRETAYDITEDLKECVSKCIIGTACISLFTGFIGGIAAVIILRKK